MYDQQGDRTKNVGVVDAEYIVHYNRPTLGGTDDKTTVKNVVSLTLTLQKCLSFHKIKISQTETYKLLLALQVSDSSQEKDHRVDVSFTMMSLFVN